MISNRTDLAPLVPIADFCETGSGGTPSRAKESLYFGGPIPWVKSGELRENTIRKTEETITVLGLKESAAKLLPRGALLGALYGATVGRVGILGIEAATNQAVCHIIPDQRRADRQYLFYALQAQVPTWLSRRVGGGQPNISQGIIRETLIPLPPLDEQKRIAYLLSKVEGLIAQRKQHLQQLDDLLKSVFLDMFGDPVRNEKGWDKKPFSELLTDIQSGKSPTCEARPAGSDEWGVLKLGAVTSCVYKEGDNKALPVDIRPHSAVEVKVGDVLFSRKNTYELVAASAYVFETRPKLLLPDLIFRLAIRGDVELNPIYLWQLLISQSQRRAIQSTANGAAGSMPNISKANLNQIRIPCPPISIQNTFAQIVSKIQGLKSSLQASLDHHETLYAVIADRAFKSELDLSRVIVPKEELDTEETNEPMNEPVDDQPFQLPSPGDVKRLKSAQGRKTVLKNWLTAYTKHLGKASIAAESFLELVQQKLSELESIEDLDGYSHEIGVAEYDQIKDWIFQNRASGELTPEYDDTENPVRASAAKD